MELWHPFEKPFFKARRICPHFPRTPSTTLIRWTSTMHVPQSPGNIFQTPLFLKKLTQNVVSNMYFTVLMAVSKNIRAEIKNYQIYLREPFREKVPILGRMQFHQKLPNILPSNSDSLFCQKFPWTREKQFW